ncbi:C40 family peptidase [Rugosimonospora acidiphila]|uniref:C40 family peptidase n=1 Tax=Rugosimonospora acidiphila TaxID=556531 RepID=A0ABP9RFR4_9ACTN
MAGFAARPPRTRLIHTFRLVRAARLVGLVAAVSGLVLAVGATTASAAPQTPGQLEAQIDQKWNQLEPLLEQWDGVHQNLVNNQAKVAGLQKKIKPLQQQVDLAMTRISALSAKYYEYGPSSNLNALLESGDPTTLVDQLGMLDAVSRSQTQSISDVVKLRQQYQKQEAPIDAMVAQLSRQQQQLTTQRTQLQSQLNQLQQMRLAAYGSGAGTGEYRPVACPQVYTGDAGSKAAQFACDQIGKSYVWDADGPDSYDCSGLTLASWRSVGVTIPHNAYQQKQTTTPVSKANLKPGDLVFYYSDVHHVVIYVGNGWVVSAPTFGKPVQMQKINTSVVNGYGRPTT